MSRKVARLKHDPLALESRREYRLIYILSLELIVIGLLLALINIFFKFWIITTILAVGTVFATANFILLLKRKDIVFSGYVICSICLVITILANLLLGGISASYLGWFYVIPILAASTTGLQGLIIFSVFSFTALTFCMFHTLLPAYIISQDYLQFVNGANYISIFALIFTVMYNLIQEYADYEEYLKNQNHLLKADRQKFHYLSNHDTLTGIPNRIYFHNYLTGALNNINTEEEAMTLYFMDLNGFKKINDDLGHETGDKLLIQAARRLKTCVRGKDLVARYGGDEFVALMVYKKSDPPLKRVMDRIKDAFETPFNINDRMISCYISIGFATYPKDTMNAEELLQLADKDMYKNKRSKSPVY